MGAATGNSAKRMAEEHGSRLGARKRKGGQEIGAPETGILLCWATDSAAKLAVASGRHVVGHMVRSVKEIRRESFERLSGGRSGLCSPCHGLPRLGRGGRAQASVPRFRRSGIRLAPVELFGNVRPPNNADKKDDAPRSVVRVAAGAFRSPPSKGRSAHVY